MADKVGFASIGLGWWGGVLAKAVAAGGEAEIRACFARSEASRRSFAGEHGCRAAESYEEVLADPAVDGVLIATSHLSHRELVEQAAAAGKHVFVEKPLTLTVEDGKAAIAAAERAGVVLQVGHQRRRNAAHRKLKELIDGGDLGEIQVAETNHSVHNALNLIPAEAWRRNRDESPLGGMTSLGIHKIDSLHYLLGPVKSVYAVTKNTLEPSSIDQATVLALEMESGVLATLVTSFYVAMISRINVFGTGGSAFNEADGSQLFVQRPGESERTPIDLVPVDPIVDQLVEFARAVRGETTPETGGAEGLEVVAVLEAAVESAATGRSVDIVR